MNNEDVARQKDMMRGREPRILHWDTEVSPIMGWSYNAWEGTMLKIEQDPMIIAVSWMWEGEKDIQVRTVADYPDYIPGRFNLNDKAIVDEIWDVLNQADFAVAQNGDAFDVKTANARFLHYGKMPTKRFVQVDTLKIARKYFRLPRYTLEEMLRYVGLEGKTKVRHSDILWDCLEGNMFKWKQMARYCQRDVKITRAFYQKIVPFHRTMPNPNIITRRDVCPSCVMRGQPGDRFIKNGHQERRNFARQAYLCLECGHQWLGEKTAIAFKRDAPDRLIEGMNQFRG